MSSRLALSRTALVAGLLVLSLSACGRRGSLEPPPDASAPQVERQEGALPSPVGTPRPRPARGYIVPDRPFILDPLL